MNIGAADVDASARGKNNNDGMSLRDSGLINKTA
jgi:hypothetical protein